MDYNLMT